MSCHNYTLSKAGDELLSELGPAWTSQTRKFNTGQIQNSWNVCLAGWWKGHLWDREMSTTVKLAAQSVVCLFRHFIFHENCSILRYKCEGNFCARRSCLFYGLPATWTHNGKGMLEIVLDYVLSMKESFLRGCFLAIQLALPACNFLLDCLGVNIIYYNTRFSFTYIYNQDFSCSISY